MTVEELIAMLDAAEPKTIVKFEGKYGEPMPLEVTGVEYNEDDVILTDE